MTESVSAEMRATIIKRLKEIELEEDLKILLAIESGSRAWGFHSPDSDYDVRFIYARPKSWHYQLGKKRDVVERPIDDELDISGWELSKALTLALSSNAVVAEWIQSPIVYQRDNDAVSDLTEFTAKVLDRKSVTWHYRSLLKRQQSRLYSPEGEVRIKRYFYVLRPTLALRWMRLNEASMPPMDMKMLRAGCDLPIGVSSALDDLTARKMAAQERAEVTVKEPELDALVEDEITRAEAWLQSAEPRDGKHLWDLANDLHMALSP